MDRLSHARRGAVFGVLAACLLANPLYIGVIVEEPRDRSPTGYTAIPVDLQNASDQQTLIDHLGDDEVVSVDHLAAANAASPRGRAYRTPAAAADLLHEARADGRATVDNVSVEFTLRRLTASYRFVAFTGNETVQYYRLARGRANTSMEISLTAVDRTIVATHVFYSDARLYRSLPEYQRETVDRVIRAEQGYRPYTEEFASLLGSVIVRNDTNYVFAEHIHVDDFGPSLQTVVQIGLSVAGVLSLFVAMISLTLSYRDA